jgi:hypothetical protein
LLSQLSVFACECKEAVKNKNIKKLKIHFIGKSYEICFKIKVSIGFDNRSVQKQDCSDIIWKTKHKKNYLAAPK